METYNTIIATINEKLQPGSNITADEHKAVEYAILGFARDQWLQGDIKMIDCTQDYINANFLTSGPQQGLGIVGGDREGWAICNGKNGTMNRTGRVPVGWGNVTSTDANGTSIQQPNMKTLGGDPIIFGNNNEALSVSQIPSHEHFVISSQQGTIVSGKEFVKNGASYGGNSSYSLGTTTYQANYGSSSLAGGGATHNNVQPSMVTLFIQKL
jgi:microcystin-dependent protein